MNKQVEEPNWIISKQPKGWYWGELAKPLGVILPETGVGPFPTAADAGLNMVRTWAMDSHAKPRTN